MVWHRLTRAGYEFQAKHVELLVRAVACLACMLRRKGCAKWRCAFRCATTAAKPSSVLPPTVGAAYHKRATWFGRLCHRSQSGSTGVRLLAYARAAGTRAGDDRNPLGHRLG